MRCSAAGTSQTSFKRPNVTLITETFTRKILHKNGKAFGVEFDNNGEVQEVYSSNSVIVSCGAIKSPQILMLSGIGPADHLRSMDIEAKNLSGVGKNLQDHLLVATGFECTKNVTIRQITNLTKTFAGLKWLLTRKGIVASNIWEMGGQIFGNHNVKYPNLQYHFAPAFNKYEGEKLSFLKAFFNCDQLRPESKGSVQLKSNNPYETPNSFFNYLSHPHDLKELREAFKKMIELISQPAFDEFRGKKIKPPDVKSNSEIDNWIRETAATDYHPSGRVKWVMSLTR